MTNPFGEGSEEAGDSLVWKVAFGVFIGTLASTFVTWTVAELRLRWEVDRAAEVLREQTLRAERAAENSNRAATSVAAKAATERAHEEEQVRRDLARQQREENELVRSRQEEASRRDLAWKRFFKPSPGCLESTASVECANEFIRAKRDFEARYAAGKL